MAPISCALTDTAQQICVFVAAYAKIRFSHDVAHISSTKSGYLSSHFTELCSKQSNNVKTISHQPSSSQKTAKTTLNNYNFCTK